MVNENHNENEKNKISLICRVLHRGLSYHSVVPWCFVEIKQRNTPSVDAKSNNEDAQAVHDEAYLRLKMILF